MRLKGEKNNRNFLLKIKTVNFADDFSLLGRSLDYGNRVSLRRQNRRESFYVTRGHHL